jgi:hypothetical protein
MKTKKSNFYIINLIIRKAKSNEDLNHTQYSELFLEFAKENPNASSSADKECMIVTAVPWEDDNRKIFGQFVEYTNIDKRKWFNLLKKDLDPDFQVPEHLRANSKRQEFFFFPEFHRFCYVFDSKNLITPQNVERFLSNGLTKFFNKKYPEKYYPEVIIEKDRNTIDQILNARSIYSLDIHVTYSNSDFGPEMKMFFDNEMKASNADKVHLNIQNKNNEPLQVRDSKIIRGALEASASHGTVEASIKEDGKQRKIKVKTADHPAKIKVPFPGIPEFTKDIYRFFKDRFRSAS